MRGFGAFCCWLLCLHTTVGESTDLDATSAKMTRERAGSEVRFRPDAVDLEPHPEIAIAKQHYERGEWQQAVEQLAPLLASRGTPAPGAVFLTAESLVQLGRYADAERAFVKLLSLKPTTALRVHARFRIAEAARLQTNPLRAQRLLQQFRRDFPAHELNAYVIHYLAESLARTGQLESARLSYDESLERFPSGPLNEQSRFQSALLHYQVEDFEAAHEQLSQLVEADTKLSEKHWPAQFWLAMSEIRLGRIEAGSKRLLDFIDSEPQHRLAPAAAFRAAEVFTALEDFDTASKLHSMVRAKWPSGIQAPRSTLALLRISALQQNLPRASALYDELLQLDDLDVRNEATRILTELLLSQKEYAQAERLMHPLVSPVDSMPRATAKASKGMDILRYALAKRGLEEYRRASELLGRIRLNTLSENEINRVLLARIETLNELQDFEHAIRQGIDYEEQFPEGKRLASVRAQMIVALVGANRLDEAHSRFETLMRMPECPEGEIARAAQPLAEALYEADQLDTARRVFKTLAQVHQNATDRVQALTGLAWIDLKQGNREGAIQRFGSFLHEFPNHPSASEVRLAYARELVDSGKEDQAIKTLEYFEHAGPHVPLRSRGRYQLADLLHRHPQHQARAFKILSGLLKEEPVFEHRDAALYLAGVLQRKLQLSDADSAFAEIVENHPTSKYWSDALYRLAESLAETDTQTAKEYLTKLTTVEVDEKILPHAIYLKGRIETAEQDWNAARETLRSLLQRFPDSELAPIARYGIAEGFFQQKRYDWAAKLFHLLAEEPFRPSDAWGAMVRLRRAQLFVREQKLVKAIRAVQTVELDFPNFELQHEVDYLLARAHAARGEFSTAREYYRKVIASDRAGKRELTAMAKWMTGETYLHQKEYMSAIDAYERVASDATYVNWQAAGLLQIGKCYESLQNLEQAAKTYSRVLNEFNDTIPANEARERLRALETSS